MIDGVKFESSLALENEKYIASSDDYLPTYLL